MGGGPYYAQLGGSRILNTSRVDQSGADDADVSGWTKTDVIIVATRIHSNAKDTEAAQYKLRWRDETDDPGGAFGDLAAAGECKFGDATALVNGTNLSEVNSRCDSQGDTWQAGEEVEGTALSDSIDLAVDYETELQFAVSLADGDDGHQYTFELYDATRGAQVGVLVAQITTVSLIDACTANDILSGTPVLGTPTAAVIHNLTANSLVSQNTVLGTPSIAQKHGLTASNIVSQNPVLGTPESIEHKNMGLSFFGLL